ncbi:MAG: ABC transporter substrate-binding protein [Acidimicrobiales bacterium]|nr:ABC transporter substrate-binding protein [Acidimicrobiales bacterium]
MGAATAVLALLLAGCGGSASDGASSDGADDGPAPTGSDDAARCEDGSGGELTMGVFSETAVVDPVKTTQGVFGAMPVLAVYDALMTFDQETRTWEPRLAESLEPNDDLTEWTLTLRPDVTFGNGNPLDAEAVKASVERHQDPDVGSLSGRVVSQITGIEVADDLTVVFTLQNPNGAFPSVLAAETGMIVDVSAIEEAGEAFGTVPSGAGAGPFEIESQAPGEELVLTAKDDYWGGEVCLDSVRFVAIPGSQPTYESFGLGELDVAFLREPSVVTQAEDDGVANFTNLRLGGDVIFINNAATEAHLDDVRVRQAIIQAIDEEAIDERAFRGDGIPTRAIADPSSLLYDGVDGTPLDPESAEGLLADVKEETGWDGKLKLQCQTVPDKVEVGIAVKAQLDAVGFDVEIEQGLGVNDWVRKVNVDRDYELACGGSISIDQAHPATNLETYRSDNVLNYLNWTSESYDGLLADLRAATDADGQAPALAAIQELWNEEAPALVYNNVDEMIVWSDEVAGLDFTINTMVFLDQATKG